MKAALLVEPGKVVVDEVGDPEPGPGEVRIAVGGVGLCGSDQSVFSGKWEVRSYPWIMGHEAFGVIDAVGPGVSAGRIGDLVVVEPNVACFECDVCRSGVTSACRGRQSLGMNRPGALAERVVISSEFAWPVSPADHIDLVCVEPATVAGAALRRLRARLPGSALVVGAGAQGLTMALALIGKGVTVFTHDINAHRIEFAAELGAAPVVDGLSFELVVDTVGSPASMATAMHHIAAGGSVICLGLDSRPLELSSQTLVRSQVTVQGSLTYDHPVDFATTLDDLAAGRIRPGQIVTDEYPLEDTQAAFENSAKARGKTWIRVGSLN
ncbi:MAG TPA: alcohol dehydrogenase catalytic domain-containing protein [Acidimicrobiia bacterium]|nr:alcohol dehydrogenase catalytic domain-containing protein [Acidimicrobiia bacterium]